MELLNSIGALHVPILLLTIATVVWADSLAALWVIGKRARVSGTLIRVLHRVITIGLLGMITTGAVLSYDRLGYLFEEPLFFVKLVFVGVLALNGFLLGRHAEVATKYSFAELSARERMPLYVSAAVSLICWGGAIVCGILL